MRVPWLPATRIVRGALGATISHQFTDSDGAAIDPTGGGGGPVTVTVTRASTGATVSVGSVTGSGTEARSVSVALSEVADVDWLTAVWSIGGVEVASDVVEVVGGVLMGQVDAAAIDKTLAGTAVSAANFRRARLATEDTLTVELGRSPFERFYTERVPGTGDSHLVLSWPDLIEVTAVNVWHGTSSTALTAAELASIVLPGGRFIQRSDGGTFPAEATIEVFYRFGMRALPSDLRDNLAMAVRHHLKKFDAALPFLGQTLELADGGGVMRQNRPGVGASITGNDDIDSRIRAYRFDPVIA